MTNSPGYVWEKMYVAISCMCGSGTLKTRLENATVSALIRLTDEDLDGELGDDLKHILKWTKENIVGGSIQKEPDDVELKLLIGKMLHVLLETNVAT